MADSSSLPGALPRRDLSGALLDGRYRVERRLGVGGMGTVWEVEHVESLQRLALKTLDLPLDPPVRERFLREARAAAALETRHVVRITDARMGYLHEGEPLPFLVMELLRGESLASLLAVRGRLTPGELVWVARQVGHALGLAHSRGIVHRDLKPGNLFVAIDDDGEPVAKLGDFGVAKLVGAAGLVLERTDAPTTGQSVVLGTPLYMAPEQLRSSGTVGPATDQWALGLVVFRALGGREYFGDAGTTTELVLRIAQDPLVPPSRLEPALTPAFDRWFLRSLARAAGERFPDVRAQVAALEAALGHPSAQAVRPGPAGLATGADGLGTAPTLEVSPAVLPERASSPRSTPATRRSRERGRLAALAGLAVLTGGALYGLGGVLPALLAMSAPSPADAVAVVAAPASPTAAPSSDGSWSRVPSSPAVPATPAAEREPVVALASGAARPSGATTRVASHAASAPPSAAPSPSAPSSSTLSPSAPSPRSGRPLPGDVAPTARPSTAGFAAGAPCFRSAQCASALCVAEICR